MTSSNQRDAIVGELRLFFGPRRIGLGRPKGIPNAPDKARRELILNALLETVKQRDLDARSLKLVLEKQLSDDIVLQEKYGDISCPRLQTIQTTIRNRALASEALAILAEAWLQQHHPAAIRTAETKRDMDDGQVLQFVNLSRAILGKHASHQKAGQKIAELQGRFSLYRPFHRDPTNQVICDILEIGASGRPFACSLSSAYPDERGQPSGLDTVGICVPHDERVLITLRCDHERYSNMIIWLKRKRTATKNGPNAGKVTIFTGFMMSWIESRAYPGSAWPVVAFRTEEDDPRKLYVGEDLKTLLLSDRIISDTLKTGAIYWDSKDYPDPFFLTHST